jgi:glutaminyl-peptide cyclotransferase
MPARDDRQTHAPERTPQAARRSRAIVWIVAALLAIAAAGVAAWAQLAHRGPTLYGFKVVAAYPHDPGAFTQGLVVENGTLYEGTGQYGASSIRRVDLKSGRVEKIHAIDNEYFGEGIAILGNKLYELTWKNQLAFVYDLDTFNIVQTFRYPTEGWGLTHDEQHLILSDGSATLRFLDPATFKTVREIDVHDGDQPVAKLNELEYVEGEIWSNIWYDDRIARISPADGRVLGWIDLAGLYPHSARRGDDVLNGIAYDATARRIFVTGKNWPQLFEIDVVRK